uniref:KIB1-4 beta-propeller domain-containing protein n=1 Tax=Aegilops tauschii TaxID=37682 RepID=R7W518_AEGTA
MGRSKGAAARRRKAAVAREAIAGPRLCPSLPPELLANIHDRLGFLDRIAFAAVFASSSDAWQRDTESGTFTSTAVTPKLIVKQGGWPCHRKYLAAGPGGRLMVVLKYAQVTKDLHSRDGWTCTFKVHVLGDDGQWKETMDIGDVALFVGVNTSLCVPTMGCPGIMAGCIYFTNDELGVAKLRRTKDLSSRSYKSCDDEPVNSDIRALGVYSLKDGMVKKMEALQQQYRIFSAPPVWITPSVP